MKMENSNNKPKDDRLLKLKPAVAALFILLILQCCVVVSMFFYNNYIWQELRKDLTTIQHHDGAVSEIREQREVLTASTLADLLKNIDGNSAVNRYIKEAVNKEMERVRLAAHELPVVSGAVYTRWGRSSCPDKASMVYRGSAAGTFFSDQAGSSEYVCLVDDPEYSKYSSGSKIYSKITGVEYENPGAGLFPTDLQNHNAPCSVCQADNRSAKIMIPAKVRCPDSSWTMEYQGYLMTEAPGITLRGDQNHHRTQYVCVDKDAEGLTLFAVDTNGALWYHVTATCKGSLGGAPGFQQCPPYLEDKELGCVVCTK